MVSSLLSSSLIIQPSSKNKKESWDQLIGNAYDLAYLCWEEREKRKAA